MSRKHGGSSGIDNLAYACLSCNRYKGTDIARAGTPVRLFDPRQEPLVRCEAPVAGLVAGGSQRVRKTVP